MQKSISVMYVENRGNMDILDNADKVDNHNASDLYPLLDPSGERDAERGPGVWYEDDYFQDPAIGTLMSNTSMSPFLFEGSGPNTSALDPSLMQGGQAVPTLNEMSIIKTTVLSVIFFVSLVGNTMTLRQMYKIRRRRSTINLLILHLAVADLIVSFFCDVTEGVWASTIQWYAGDSMCKFIKFLQAFGLYLSTYIVVIISIDRCIAILDPMSRNKAPRRVKGMIIFAWLISALFSVPQVSTTYVTASEYYSRLNRAFLSWWLNIYFTFTKVVPKEWARLRF